MSVWQRLSGKSNWLRERASEISGIASILRGGLGAGDLSALLPESANAEILRDFPEQEFSFEKFVDHQVAAGKFYPREIATAEFLAQSGLSRLEGQSVLCTRAGGDLISFRENPETSFCIVNIGRAGRTFRLLRASEDETLPAPGFIFNLLAHSGRQCEEEAVILHAHVPEMTLLARRMGFARDEAAFNSVLKKQALAMMLQDRTILRAFNEPVAVLPLLIPGSREQWSQTAAALANHRTVLWKFHGLFLMGPTISECEHRLACFETCAYAALLALQAKLENPSRDDLRAIKSWCGDHFSSIEAKIFDELSDSGEFSEQKNGVAFQIGDEGGQSGKEERSMDPHTSITDFGDEPYKARRPIPVNIEHSPDGEAFIAGFVDAGIYAEGETIDEAIEILTSDILDTFDFLSHEPPDRLGKKIQSQLAVLKRFIDRMPECTSGSNSETPSQSRRN